MSSKTITKPKAKSAYFGETPLDTSWLMMRMADRLTRHDLVAFRMSQFLHSCPEASPKQAQDFWNAQMQSLNLLVEAGS